MNRKLTAVLLILAAVLANLAFTALGSIFNYPDVLDEPAGRVLASFREHEGAVSAWFAVLALSAALFAPIAIGVGRLSSARAMRYAVGVGIAAAVVQVIGLDALAAARAGLRLRRDERDPAVAADARDAFTSASDLLGTAIGETLGYLLTAVWTVLVIAALGRGFAGRWFAVLGGVSAALVFAGVFAPLGVELLDTANFVGYVLWSISADRVRGRAARCASAGPPACRRRRAGRRYVVTGRAGSRSACCARACSRSSSTTRSSTSRCRRWCASCRRGHRRARVGGRRGHASLRRAAPVGPGARRPRRRRRMLLAGLLVFGVASTAAAYAVGIGALIAARAVMGAGAALIMPTMLAADQRVRGRARAGDGRRHRAATAGLGVALGPSVGGYLLEHFWWGSIFIVNVPLCVLAIVVGRRGGPRVADAAARRIDWAGAALSGTGLIRADVGDHRGAVRGLDVAGGRRHGRRRAGPARRVRGAAAPHARAAARRGPVPQCALQRGERRDHGAVLRALRVPVPGHPVPAVRARAPPVEAGVCSSPTRAR